LFVEGPRLQPLGRAKATGLVLIFAEQGRLTRRSLGFVSERLCIARHAVAPDAEASLGPALRLTSFLSLLCPEAANAVELYAARVNPSRDEIFDPTKHPEEPTREVGKRPLEGRIGRLNQGPIGE